MKTNNKNLRYELRWKEKLFTNTQRALSKIVYFYSRYNIKYDVFNVRVIIEKRGILKTHFKYVFVKSDIIFAF